MLVLRLGVSDCCDERPSFKGFKFAWSLNYVKLLKTKNQFNPLVPRIKKFAN